MSFQNILGQNQAVDIIIKSIKNKSLSHTYLFFGPSGVGKKKTALELAMALNCHEWGPSDNCGFCVSCRKIKKNVHPDFFLVQPGKTSPKVREAFIRIDDIRNLQKKLDFRPYEGKTKVVIVDEAEKMNLQAANTFLKTLEEPPGQTIIILVTNNLFQLLPTLVSRCQGVKFSPLATTTIRTILSNMGMDLTKADRKARRANGRLDLALDENMLGNGQTRQELVTLLEEISFDRMDLVFRWAKAWSRQQDKLPGALEELSIILRDLALIRSCCPVKHIINNDIANELESLAIKRRRSDWLNMFRCVGETSQFIKKNLNVQLLLERMLIQFCETI